jgi:hypothetical protein
MELQWNHTGILMELHQSYSDSQWNYNGITPEF